MKEATSVTHSSDGRRQKIQIWPEWSDADINAEKWEAVHKVKEKEKPGKSPVQTQHSYFDDPEGRIILPPSLLASQWKRPLDIITDKIPVVIDPAGSFDFNLFYSNDHILHSETIRWIITQIDALWKLSASPATGAETIDTPVSPDGMVYQWRPWEHIYAMTKIGKGANLPQYNPYGKYVVKLFWLGSWRKIIVDDLIPFNEIDECLLPMTNLKHELWLMLLSKALLKVASLDYGGGAGNTEFGDFNVIHCLTGWLPQTMLIKKDRPDLVWDLIKKLLPEWKLPEISDKEMTSNTPDDDLTKDPQNTTVDATDKTVETAPINSKEKPKEDKTNKSGRDTSKDKKDVKEKDKANKEKVTPEAVNVYEKPEVLVFASYHDAVRKQPFSTVSLTETTDISENLRQQGLSYLFSHPVILNKFRTCPLTPEPPPEVIPVWKQIRPRIKKTFPTSEERSEITAPPVIIKSVEIESPFLHYKVSHIPFLVSTARPNSAIIKGSIKGASPNQPMVPEIDNETDDLDTVLLSSKEIQRGNTEPIIGATLNNSLNQPGTGEMKKSIFLANNVPKANQLTTKKAATEIIAPSPDIKKSVAATIGKKPVPNNSSPTKDATGKIAAVATIPLQEPKASLKPEINEELMVDEITDAEKTDANLDDALTMSVIKKTWLDINIFCNCFQKIHVYHKVHTYPHSKFYADMKEHIANPNAQTGVKEAPTPGPAAGKKGAAAASTTVTVSDERQPSYLFVDSLQPSEIIFCMSALCRWNDLSSNPLVAQSGLKSARDDQSVAEMDVPQPSFGGTTIIASSKPQVDIPQASMISEFHFWKSITVGNAFKQMKTSGVRAISFLFPEGRHCLKIYNRAPLAYHLQLVSSTPFAFGDEEIMMPLLVKEPLRCLNYSKQLSLAFGRVLNFASTPDLANLSRQNGSSLTDNFVDPQLAWKQACDDYEKLHCPYGSCIPNRGVDRVSKKYHFQIYKDIFYTELGKILPQDLRNADVTFALRVITRDLTSINPLNLTPPAQKSGSELDSSLSWEPSISQLIAAVRLQKCWRGFYTRKVLSALSDMHSKDFTRVSTACKKILTILEPLAESFGSALLKSLFNADLRLMQHFEFAPDKQNHIVYQDYTGAYADQQPHSWFVLFRGIFYASHNNSLMLPKLYTPFPSCVLRIIDNDTRQELPRSLGEKMPPHIYNVNNKGYTLVAIGQSLIMPLMSNKWRLRIIGDVSPLLAPAVGNEICGVFNNNEIHDYYVPNDKCVILRQCVKVVADRLVTIYVKLSSPEVFAKLSVLDNDKEIISVKGKGLLVIPAFIFEKDPEDLTSGTRTPSRASKRGNKKAVASNAEAHSSSESLNRPNSTGSIRSIDSGVTRRQHKYVIEATVLNNSWPISTSNWAFVNIIKEQEKDEMKLTGKPHTDSTHSMTRVDQKRDSVTSAPTKSTTKLSSKAGGKTEKGGKSSADRNKEQAALVPEIAPIDTTKAHWILKVVSDANAADEMTIKKETEHIEAVCAMKKAWEEMEPGRAEQARQSRLRFLNSQSLLTQVEPTPLESTVLKSDSEVTSKALLTASSELIQDEVYTTELPTIMSQRDVLPPVDFSRFLKGDPSKAAYISYSSLQKMQLADKRQSVEQFRVLTENWKEFLKMERGLRNNQKTEQLQLAQTLQTQVDSYREAYFRLRESYRQQMLEEERKRLEDLAAAEALLNASQTVVEIVKSPKGGKKTAEKAGAKKK